VRANKRWLVAAMLKRITIAHVRGQESQSDMSQIVVLHIPHSSRHVPAEDLFASMTQNWTTNCTADFFLRKLRIACFWRRMTYQHC
jgi:hypothetical protein